MRTQLIGALGSVLLTSMCGPFARADTTFDVSGPYSPCRTSCVYSGTLDVNTRSGVVTGVDITFPDFSPFSTLEGSGPYQPSDWRVYAINPGIPDYFLLLNFTNSSGNPYSLQGFNGGSVLLAGVFDQSTGQFIDLGSGSITPAAPVPEPATLSLVGLGLAGIGFARRRRKT